MDKIIIKDARFLCNIGVSKEERREKQKIFVDVELFVDAKKPSQKDDIEDTINYSEVYNLTKKAIEMRDYKLIETMAENIANKILVGFPVKKVLIRIKKPEALKNAKYAAVEIVREKYG